MTKTFGFTDDEVKLLLVSVRHMRRTFAVALKSAPDPSLEAYSALYDALFAKLRDMAGPIPPTIEDIIEP
jgi:hypothetical protein